MRPPRWPMVGGILLAATATLAPQMRARSPQTRFTTIPGFVVEQVTPPDRTAESYVNMTFDSLGRPVLSKEGAGPRTLFDRDGDGMFESEIVFSDLVRDCQGLWFDARTLYGVCVGPSDKQMGLYRLQDVDGDDVADTVERVSTLNGGTGGHGAHAIRRGPDGQPVLMLGNMSGVPAEMIDSDSPLRNTREGQLLARYDDPRGHAVGVMAPGGTIVRLNRDRRTYSVLTGGFRNAYDLAFNLAGETFTFDSDMEWDINLPWYREVRSVHAIPGGDYGWRHGSGKLPAYYLETLPPVRAVGRGSPVGVEFYQSDAYPQEFHDAFFEGDWSRGRLLYTAVTRSGATYSMRGDAAEFVRGEPLNITDLEVGPDGLMYFCTGGWTTDGGLYRVRYFGEAPERDRPTGVLALVRQPQPLSSWGWAALEKIRAAMGSAWATGLERLAGDVSAAPRDREQALLTLQRHGDPPGADLLARLTRDRHVEVRAAAVYVAGAQSGDGARAVAISALTDIDPFVRRRAAEALVRHGGPANGAVLGNVYALLQDSDRFVRYAGRLALERMPRHAWRDRVLREQNPRAASEGLYALLRTAREEGDFPPLFDRQLELLRRTDLSVDDRLRLLRVFQLTAMEAPGGAGAELRRQVHHLIAGQFPSGDDRLDRELALTLAYCGQPQAIGSILAAMPPGDANQPLQIHYVYALRAITEGWTPEQRGQLMTWYARASTWRGGASFSGYINRLFDSTVALLDDEEKRRAYETFPQFAPLTLDELSARRAREADVPAAVRSRGVETVTREEILEYQIFVPTRHRPSADAGGGHFEQLCASCHVFGGVGSSVGPDLTTVSRRFNRKDILSKILWPSRAISDPEQYATTMIETTDGQVVTGLVVREDERTIVLRVPQATERPVEIPKTQIRERARSPVSMMPEGLIDGLTQEQIADLLAFLQSGPATP